MTMNSDSELPVETKKPRGGGRPKKTILPLNDGEIKQRKEALEIARTKKSEYGKRAKELQKKEDEINEIILKTHKLKLKEEVPEVVPVDVSEPVAAVIEPVEEPVIVPLYNKKEPKIKKKVQRIVEVSDSSSEEEEIVYVKKPKAPKASQGVKQADYIEMVKQTASEKMRKELENERIRIAMVSMFPNQYKFN